jgi:uracil-DNA glycosylase family 4
MSTNLQHLFLDSLESDNSAKIADASFPFLSLTAPDMPMVGPNFVAHAVELGDQIDVTKLGKNKENPAGEYLRYLYRRATYDIGFTLPVSTKSGLQVVRFMPGHIHGPTSARPPQFYGPRPAKIMIVGKNPGNDELNGGHAFGGRSVIPLKNVFQECGLTVADIAPWYITFVCKFDPPVKDSAAISAAWIRDCAPILAQELRIVQPDYILCLGVEATKAVLATSANVSNLAGRALPVTFTLPDGATKTAKAVSVMHPAFVARKPEVYDDFRSQVSKFIELINGRLEETEQVDHAEIYDADSLRELVDSMIADPDPLANIIAVDCEWHGDHPTEPNAYLRTVQVSNKNKWARTIVLRYEGGAVAFSPNIEAAKVQLARLLKSTPDRHVRIGGHFLRADLPWLIDLGVDARPEYAPAESPEDRMHGGWDTSLMYHAINECARYGLDACTLRFTSAPAYWARLDEWKKNYCSKNKIKAEQMDGYGACPGHILHPYANYDADVTRRIMLRFFGTNGHDGLLAKDMYGNDCWLPYWTAHCASLAFLEMELVGLVVDRDRADELTRLFMETQHRLLEEIRADLNWPAFNPKSHPQLAVALFGEGFAGRYTTPINAPEDAVFLNLTPIKTTGKRPKLWNDLPPVDRQSVAIPSTDKESLGILGHVNETAAKIRDYKFISQVLVSILRKPETTEAGDFDIDENGNFKYEKGIVGSTHADGCVRTHFFQTKETGRASSSRPPLQNLSKRREGDYSRIVGPAYQHPVRSILRVPEGYVGIETDLTGAELAVLAWLSQDLNFIEHVQRNNLPSTHPDHYDIHSRQAVKAFNLVGVEPTKDGLKAANKVGLRVAAKNVNFGIPYGRGAEAIARQCKEEGVSVTADDCQKMIDAYFDTYPKTADFLAECRARSQDPRWIVGPYGRFRRFLPSNDRAVIGEQQRQAQNFPIQGGVADAVSLALSNFYQYRIEHPEVDYKIILQIHDAIVLCAPLEHAERVYKEVIPECMIHRVPFWPRYLDGQLIPVEKPYYFGADREVFVHWGEHIEPEQAKQLGLDWLYT